MTHRALVSVRFHGGEDPEQVAARLVDALEDFTEVIEADVAWVNDPEPEHASARLAAVASQIRPLAGYRARRLAAVPEPLASRRAPREDT